MGCLASLSNAVTVTMTSRFFLNLHTTSIEMRQLNPTTRIPSANTRIAVQPNFAFLGSNVDDDVWDSKFTLTEKSCVDSFDAFDNDIEKKAMELEW